jgi:hypothetical protein
MLKEFPKGDSDKQWQRLLIFNTKQGDFSHFEGYWWPLKRTGSVE